MLKQEEHEPAKKRRRSRERRPSSKKRKTLPVQIKEELKFEDTTFNSVEERDAFKARLKAQAVKPNTNKSRLYFAKIFGSCNGLAWFPTKTRIVPPEHLTTVAHIRFHSSDGKLLARVLGQRKR